MSEPRKPCRANWDGVVCLTHNHSVWQCLMDLEAELSAVKTERDELQSGIDAVWDILRAARGLTPDAVRATTLLWPLASYSHSSEAGKGTDKGGHSGLSDGPDSDRGRLETDAPAVKESWGHLGDPYQSGPGGE